MQTVLGEIFVVSPDTTRTWAIGDAMSLSLQDTGVSVVAA